MSAWTTTVVFALMAIINMFLSLAFIIKYFYKMKRRRNDDDNELDAFNKNFEDDDDDHLLDPSKNPTASHLQFEGDNADHTSFPPYNTGSDVGVNNPW